VEFRVLGPVEAFADDGTHLPIGAGKPRALLARLLLEANHVVASSRLVEDLWGDRPPDTATTALHVYVSALRKALPPDRLITKAPGYLLRVAPGELDLERFEHLLADARTGLAAGDPGAAGRSLRAALELWRGPPLGELADQPFAAAELGRLEELHAVAVEERVEADLAAGRHSEVVPELEALVERNPLRERLRGQLMLALYRSGRQADALAAFRAAHRTLRDELGIEPGPGLRGLHAAILAQAPELEPQARGTAKVEPREAPATVVFVVAGPAAAGAEAREIRALLDRVHEAVAEELEAAGANVARGLAGAELATFPPDPVPALHAVAAVRSRLAALFQDAVAARFGVETGDVLTGGPADPITGPPVAAAARLVQAARPGEILVGPVAADAARRAFTLRTRAGHEVLVGARDPR
jgi:DNA-binding SARP family transcriptional activator